MSERERVLLYYMMMVSTKWWFLKNNQNVFVVKEFHIISMRMSSKHFSDEIIENDFAYFIVENYEQSCRNVKDVLKRRE